MILNKKIAKLPKRSILRSSQAQQQDSFDEDEGSSSPYMEKKYVKRFRFRQIPQHTKYTYNDPIYPIKGDIPVMLCDGNLTTEISMFNETKIFPNITIVEKYNQRLVLLKPTSRKDKKFNPITELFDEFEKSEDSEHQKWHKTFKTFYQTYEKVMKRQSRKKTKSDTRKRFYNKVDVKTKEKTEYLYENFPILQLKYRLRNHQSQLYEIVFSEAFIHELGSDVDSFISSVLKEGLPQLMPLNNPCSTVLLKTLVNNYFTIENTGCEIPDQISTLFMKNGYAKDVNYQINLLMNYETNTFGMDVIFALKAKGEPYLVNPKYIDTKINDVFVQNMTKKENEADRFLSEYYASSVEKRYTNYSKICKIKELDMQVEVDDEIVVKKDEDA